MKFDPHIWVALILAVGAVVLGVLGKGGVVALACMAFLVVALG